MKVLVIETVPEALEVLLAFSGPEFTAWRRNPQQFRDLLQPVGERTDVGIASFEPEELPGEGGGRLWRLRVVGTRVEAVLAEHGRPRVLHNNRTALVLGLISRMDEAIAPLLES